MIILFIVLVLCISIFDLIRLRNKGTKRDVIFFVFFMIFVATIGLLYFKDTYQPAIAEYILNYFNIKV